MNSTSSVPDASTAWTLWHSDTFDRATPDSVEAQGTNILNGLYELWKRTLSEGIDRDGGTSFSTFRLTWGETVAMTAGAGVYPFNNTDHMKLRLWATLIGEHQLLCAIAALHLRFLQTSSRWTALSLNPNEEARELLAQVRSMTDPRQLTKHDR